MPGVDAQTLSGAERDRGLERLRTWTIAAIWGAAALAVALSFLAAAGIPGHTSSGSASTSGGDSLFQNQPQPPSIGSFGTSGGGRPFVVSGGS